MLYDWIEFPNNAPLNLSVVEVENYPFHMHSGTLEIIFVLEGSFELTVVNNVLPMAAGDIYISSPNELHRLRAYEHARSLIMLIHVDLSTYKAKFPHIETYQFANTAVEKNSVGLHILGDYLKKQLPRLFERPQAEPSALYAAGEEMLRILIQEFQCYYLGKGYPEYNSIYKGNDVQLNRVRRIIDYIYKNYNRPIKIEDVAEMEHISTYHLTHILKNGSGVSFRTFLNMARAEKSAILLLENEKSLQAIAYECGFSKYKYFSESFEKVFRTTPQKYRNTYCGHTIAVQKRSVRALEGAELGSFLKRYYSSAEKIDLDLRRSYPAEPFYKPRRVRLSGAQYNHITDFCTLGDLKRELCFDELVVDAGFLRVHKNSARTLGRILSDMRSLHLSICIQIAPGERLQDVKTCLELLKAAQCAAASEWVSFSVPAEQEGRTTNAKSLKKLVTAYGFAVSEAAWAPTAQRNPIHGSGYMPCFLLQAFSEGAYACADQLTAWDSSGPDRAGGLALMWDKVIKTPVYYLLYLLERMGHALIAHGEMYFVTQSADTLDFQILVYYYDECFDLLFKDVSKAAEHATVMDMIARGGESNREVTLRVDHISGRYALRRYQLAPEDYLSKYRDSGPLAPEVLSEETLRVLNETLAPKPSLSVLDLNGAYDIKFKLNPFELVLFAFEKI